MIQNDGTAAPGRRDAAPRTNRLSLKRLAPMVVLALGAIAFFALGLDNYLTLEALREHRALLADFVAANSVAAPILFIALYALAIAFSVPGGAVMTITGGFLFGTVFGTVWVVIAATIGATGLFVIAKTAFGDALRAKAGPWLEKLEAGFQENALSYLLVLRLIPLFPFVVVNLVPALLGVRLRIYVLGTALGIIPGSFVFTSVGAGLGSLFDMTVDGAFELSAILTPEIVTALVGLAVLSLVPVAYKTFKTRHAKTLVDATPIPADDKS